MTTRKMRGFTLIELLVVIAIIGALAAILIPNLLSSTDKVKAASTETLISNIGTALESYSSDISSTGRYPEGDGSPNYYTGAMLQTLRDNNLMEITDENIEPHPDDATMSVFVDAWQTPLKYRPWKGVSGDKSEAHNKDSYDLWSAGPDALWEETDTNNDGDVDDEDNICNWSRELEAQDQN